MSKERKKFWGLTITQMLITIALLLTKKICFATNDDTTMVDIVSGGYGECSPYIINIHIFLGYLYKTLFECIKGINWVTISYLVSYFFSSIIINKVFSRKKYNYPIIYTILNICYILVISYFSFTVVAYYALIAGCITFVYAVDNHEKKYYILSVLVIFIGVLFRGEAIKSICIVLSAYVIYYFGKKTCCKYIGLLIGLVVIMYSSIYSNLVIEKQNPIEKEHLTWGETRSEALDCAVVPYDQEDFDREGISLEQYMAMYNAFYYDYENISTSAFEKLKILNSTSNKYNFDIVQFFSMYFDRIKQVNKFSYVYIWLLALVLVYFVIQSFQQNNKREILAFWIFVMLIMADLIFYIIQRNPYRVVMPNYVLGILLITYELEDKEVINIENHYLRCGIISAILAIPLVTMALRYVKYDLVPESLICDERKYILNYLAENNNVVYMAGDPRVFSLDVGRSIWEYTAEYGYWNVMGNWEIYGQAYYDLMNIYQIENPDSLLLESLVNDNVLILTSFGEDFETNYWYITSWLKKYYDIDAEFRMVERITDVNITDDIYENWAVYRLVIVD